MCLVTWASVNICVHNSCHGDLNTVASKIFEGGKKKRREGRIEKEKEDVFLELEADFFRHSHRRWLISWHDSSESYTKFYNNEISCGWQLLAPPQKKKK